MLPAIAPISVQPAMAGPGDRTLYLYYTHTKETAKFTFRKGGQYDRKVLAQINTFLRDWRRNEPTKMDPALFDLVWEVYQESGASGPIHIVSAYRAPATNEMLRSKSKGVAKNSRHTMGMAMDFFIPGVSLPKLRSIAMSKQVGGVGYYPTSGSPFVHLDTGNVRAWPRMTRAQLEKVFPNGKTLHIPADGKLLSDRGYQLAKAEWTKCHSVPCNGRSSSDRILVADDNGKPKKGLLDFLFNNEEDEGSEESPGIQLASSGPNSRSVTSVAVAPPQPFDRPAALALIADQPTMLVASAPVPMQRPANRPASIPFEDRSSLAVAAIDANLTPAPRALLSRPTAAEPDPAAATLTAYAPISPPAPEAQRALDQLIARKLADKRDTQPTPSAPAKFEIASDTIRTASLNPPMKMDGLSNLIENSWTAVSKAGTANATTSIRPASPVKPNPFAHLTTRQAELVAPDTDHITEIFIDPRAISSGRYAVLFENDAADFDPATEMGQHISTVGFARSYGFEAQTSQFTNQKTLKLAAR